tara:strand:+ start:410 stop:607 length:198 start_codon:yes stop_codon:yes gene_type:complete
MQCYRCDGPMGDMPLARLRAYERKVYIMANVVIRECKNCGLEQSHVGDGETLTAKEAGENAPSYE